MVTDELKKEGIARELVNRIQNIRKSSGFEIVDKINVVIQSHPQVNEAVESYNYYIANQILANRVVLENLTEGTTLYLDDFQLLIKVDKVYDNFG
jgi:isoleucyl-tRNA synthetase